MVQYFIFYLQLSIDFVTGEPLQYSPTEGYGTDFPRYFWRFAEIS